MLLELRPTISTPLSILSPGFFSTGWEFSFGARIFQKYDRFPSCRVVFQHLTCSRPPGSYSLQMSALMPSVTFISSRSDHQENIYTKWRKKISLQAKCPELSLHFTATLLERLTLVLFSTHVNIHLQEMVEEDWQHALYDLAFVLCDKYLTGHSKCNDIY